MYKWGPMLEAASPRALGVDGAERAVERKRGCVKRISKRGRFCRSAYVLGKWGREGSPGPLSQAVG